MKQILFSFGLIIGAGVFFRRLKIGGMDADTMRKAISISVFNLFLPALCIKVTYTVSLGAEAILIPITAWFTILLLLLMALITYWILGKKWNIHPSQKGTLVLGAVFGNVTYLGLPVLTELYGPHAAKYALFFDLMASTPLVWTAGATLATHYGKNQGVSMVDSLKKLASLPPLWAITTGIVLNISGVTLPEFIVKTLSMFANLVVPLMIFTIGLALVIPKVKDAYIIIPAVILKLVAAPFIAYTIGCTLGIEGEALASCFIEGAMPTMVLSLLIAAQFKLDVTLAAFIIVITTFLSFFTLPVIVYLTNIWIF